jgi:hypothetical protein
MKYFTPHRYVQFQKIADETAFYAAHEEWDRALEDYGEHLRKIESFLPRSVQHFRKEFCPHDADVLAIYRSDRTLTITLQLDFPKGVVLILTYSLVDEPEINRSALPEEHCSPRPLWLYEEFDIAQPVGSDQGHAVYVQDILLSNGWEIRLRFRKLSVSKREAVFPMAEGVPDVAPTAVSQSA